MMRYTNAYDADPPPIKLSYDDPSRQYRQFF